VSMVITSVYNRSRKIRKLSECQIQRNEEVGELQRPINGSATGNYVMLKFTPVAN
jgi:hypothetical protein